MPNCVVLSNPWVALEPLSVLAGEAVGCHGIVDFVALIGNLAMSVLFFPKNVPCPLSNGWLKWQMAAFLLSLVLISQSRRDRTEIRKKWAA